ncbi:MAG: GGDEF domain-containing protein, partial [Desulfobacteraceae bacterium]|nr:GGDEF domain-containing protein [Desulfobacteraceae bacterium]
MANDTFLRDWIIQGEHDVEKITRYLSSIHKKYNVFTSFLVSEQTKTYYHAGGILKKVQKGEKRDRWYFRVRSMKPEYEINVDPDLANKDSMTIFINYRVFDYENNFIGATGIGLKVNAVKNLIKKYQDNYDRNIYFVDENGAVKLNGAGTVKDESDLTEIVGVSSIANDILSGQDGYFTYKRKGKTIHLNTRFIPEFGWYLLIEQAEAETTRPILNALLVNLAVCAVITLVVLIVTNLTISSYQNKLEKMAATDKLTGIFNRHAVDVIFNQLLKDVQREHYDLSVILYDIDFFKKVNDQYGHLAGDLVLQSIVKLTKKIIRDSDMLCRWGGEEFLILLRECNLNDAYIISEKIRKAVNNMPVIYKNKEIHVTLSLGVTCYQLPEKEDDLLLRVDNLLYRAKKNGRNRSEKDAV